LRGGGPPVRIAFEIGPVRLILNVPAMISLARGNEITTTPVHAKSFDPR